MSIIVWILLGLIAGALAKAIMPGDDPGGIIVTILIGIAGAIVGGFLWNLLTGNNTYGDFDIGGIIIAIVGSIILLAGYRFIAARRGTTISASQERAASGLTIAKIWSGFMWRILVRSSFRVQARAAVPAGRAGPGRAVRRTRPRRRRRR